MRSLRRFGTFFACFCLLSCQKAAEPPAKVVCVLFDFSESTNTPEIRQRYVQHFRAIQARILPGEVIAVCPITEKSVAEQELILRCEFPRFKASTDNLLIERGEHRKFEARMQTMRDSLCDAVDAALIHARRKVMSTDIMSALHVAERIFKKSSSQPRKVLVLISDMIEESSAYNFARATLTDQKIREIIAAETQNHRLPDLTGVKIHVIGANAANREKFFQVRDFWLEYFRACGGIIPSENYGATLVNFEE